MLVEHRGFEPLTSTLPVWRAPNCANAPFDLIVKLFYYIAAAKSRKIYRRLALIFLLPFLLRRTVIFRAFSEKLCIKSFLFAKYRAVRIVFIVVLC